MFILNLIKVFPTYRRLSVIYFYRNLSNQRTINQPVTNKIQGLRRVMWLLKQNIQLFKSETLLLGLKQTKNLL
jgi:hypothetical protein